MYYDRIAHFADIDTRRAMGYPPRKLDLTPWKDFKPRGFEGELYRYFVNEHRLEYMEMWEYDCIYYEVITDIRPSDVVEHAWETLNDSVARGVFQGHHRTDIYSTKRSNERFYTAGWPVFVIKTPTPD